MLKKTPKYIKKKKHKISEDKQKKVKLISLIFLLIIIAPSIFSFFSIKNDTNSFRENPISIPLKTSIDPDDIVFKNNISWGRPYDDIVRDSATDSQGNVYLTGYTKNASGDMDVLLVKFNQNGDEQWNRTWGGYQDEQALEICITELDDIYITGVTESFGDLDGDVFIIKYNSTGYQQWNLTWASDQEDSANGIGIDSSGNIYVAGTTKRDDSQGDIFITKFNSNRVEQWNITYGDPGDQDNALSLAVDSFDYVYISSFSETDGTSTNGNIATFKYNSTGNLEWKEIWDGGVNDEGFDLCLDSSNNVYVGGYTFPPSSAYGCIIKYDQDGNFQWSDTFGQASIYGNFWYGITIDSNDEIYVGGRTTTHGPSEGVDGIFFNYNTSGNRNWYKNWGSTGDECFTTFSCDSDNNLYCSGSTDSYGVGENDIFLLKYEKNNTIDIITPINDTITAPDAGYYPGTFGFEDIKDNDKPFNWETFEYGGTINVIQEVDVHKKVLELFDNNSGATVHARQNFGLNQNNDGDSIEFYWRTTDNSSRSEFLVKDDAGTIGPYLFQDNNGYYRRYNGVGWTNLFICNNDQWYHHRIIINYTAQTYDWYIDNDLKQADIPFSSTITHSRQISMISSTTDNNYYLYLDAIGYSWDPNYEIGNNLNEGLLISYENSKRLDWMGYSLDGAANVTIQGNKTIPLPDDGQHSVQLFGTPNRILNGSLVDDVNWVPGKVGDYALNFDGVNDYVDISSELIEDRAPEFAITVWFNPDDTSSGTRQIIYESAPGTWAISLELAATTNNLKYSVQVGNGIDVIRETNVKPTEGNWHHAVLVYKENQYIKIYYDGSELSGYEESPSGDLYLTDGLHIGTYRSADDRWYDGQIDDLRFYNEVINDTEINWIYNSGFGRNESLSTNSSMKSESHWWKFEEGSGNMIYDSCIITNHQSDVRYFTIRNDTISIVTPYSTTYTSPDAGYYPATYGFENDINGMIANNWIDLSTSGEWVRVDSGIDSHNKTLKFYDNEFGSEYSFAHLSYTAQTNGTIEFWIYKLDQNSGGLGDGGWEILTRSGGSLGEIGVNIQGDSGDDGELVYINGTRNTIGNVQRNKWHHLRIDFECGFGGYKGLSNDTYDIYLDGIQKKQGAQFYENIDSFDTLQFAGDSSRTGIFFIDSVGCSWDPNYIIGDNLNEGLLLSYENTTELDWTGYSLDGALNITIQGNTTIKLPVDGSHFIQVFGNDTMGTNYQSDVKYFTVKNGTISIVTPYSTTYTTPDAGYYPGTFGFEDIKNNDDPINWEVFESGGTINVIQEVEDHKKVLELNDINDGAGIQTRQDFGTNQNNDGDTIEFHWRTTDNSQRSEFQVRNDAGTIGPYLFQDNNGYYRRFNGLGWTNLFICNNNQWYHHRIVINYTAQTYDWYIDNDLKQADIPFSSMITHSRDIRMVSSTPDNNYSIYFDAIGYSWDPYYEIGDNMNEGLLLNYENATVLDWMGYSLDGAANITIQGSTTIPMPTGNGLHTIQVFGNTSIGTTYQSDMQYFTLDWEYTSLRPTTNYLDIIDDLDLFIEISMNSIGFLKIDRTTFGLPTFPYLVNNQTRISFYKFKVFNANFDEDESMISSITLRFYYNPADVSNINNLRVYHYSSSEGRWISEEVTINQAGNYVEITITELSWFSFGEFSFPPGIVFPWWLLVLILVLSIIGISIPSAYVVISKKKKKKKGMMQEKKQQALAEEISTPHEIEMNLQREKVPEIRRQQVTPILPVESKVIRKTEPHKKPRKEKIKPEKPPTQVESEEKEKKREIEETESEMDIAEDIDRCVIHKGPLTGITYICPKCKAKYCLKCATTLSKRKESCWICEALINISSGEEELPARINKVQKNPLDNSNLLQVVEGENIIEKIAKSGGIEITLLEKDFLAKIEQFDWEENDKNEFIREMLSLTPEKRELILNRMIETSARDEEM